jgi:hypothetical protein
VNSIARTFAVLLAVAATAWAESVTVSPGISVDCPVPVSTADNKRTRTVVLPSEGIARVATTAPESDLEVKHYKNTLVLNLKNPAFEASLQVWDIENNLYLLTVRSPAEDDATDESLILVKDRRAGADGSQATGSPKTILQDTDQAVVTLMSQMRGGVTEDRVSWMAITSVDRGKVIPGKRLYADDNLEIRLQRVYRSPGLYGYETTWTWHGRQNIVVNLQSVWIPLVIATSASDQAILAQQNPDVVLPANRTIKVYYVCGEE